MYQDLLENHRTGKGWRDAETNTKRKAKSSCTKQELTAENWHTQQRWWSHVAHFYSSQYCSSSKRSYHRTPMTMTIISSGQFAVWGFSHFWDLDFTVQSSHQFDGTWHLTSRDVSLDKWEIPSLLKIHLRVVGHVVAKEKNMFFTGVA